MCLQVITKAAFWMFDCVCLYIQNSQTLEEAENERYREGENKRRGKWKMQVVCACAYGSVHLKCISIECATPQLWETKVMLCGHQREIIGLRDIVHSILSLLQVCFYGREKRGVSDVQLLLHTWPVVGKWLFYTCAICALTSPVSASLFPLLPVLGWKKLL